MLVAVMDDVCVFGAGLVLGAATDTFGECESDNLSNALAISSTDGRWDEVVLSSVTLFPRSLGIIAR